MRIITNPNQLDKKKWEEFVNEHPNGNVFQSPGFFEVLKRVPQYKPFVILAQMNGKIQGVMTGVIQKEIGGYLGYFTSRSIIMGGPLVDNNNTHILEGILQDYSKHFSRKSLYTQFRNIHDVSWSKDIFEKMGFRYEEHLDILISLNVSFENLRAAMHKSRRRNLTKAINKGVELVEIKTIDELNSGIDLIHETYNRVNLPYPDASLFREAFKVLSPQNKFKGFLAINDGNVIGIRMVLLYKKLIYDWFAGSSFNERNKYPNDFLISHILMWGRENGYTVFDFGGAGRPDEKYGVRDHKLKFGGNLVNFGRFQKIYNPAIYYPVMFAFKFWQKIKK